MKLCLIGSRGHVNYVLEGLEAMPHVRVAGISSGGVSESNDIGRLTAWCATHGHAAPVFEDYRRMLDETKPDAVSVCGAFERHAEMCRAAFERGIHVFSEKPVAMDLDELAMLRRAHAGTGLHFAGMMGIRYEPAFWTARAAVRAGAVGAVRLLSARKSYKLGKRDPFYCRRATSSGLIPWVGSHAIDWIHWFSGERFVSVYAAHSTRANGGYGDLEASGACLFRMTNEVSATVTMDFLRPAAAPTHGDDRIRVAGTEGVIEVRDGQVRLISAASQGERILQPAADHSVFGDFVAHVEGRGASELDAAATFAVTEACLLARQSADEDRLVRFPGA